MHIWFHQVRFHSWSTFNFPKWSENPFRIINNDITRAYTVSAPSLSAELSVPNFEKRRSEKKVSAWGDLRGPAMDIYLGAYYVSCQKRLKKFCGILVLLNYLNVTRNLDVFIGCSEINISVIVKHV